MIRELFNELIEASELDVDHRWRKWAKRIDAVDTTKANGYAFDGAFVNEGTIEVSAQAALYLVASETGSNKYRRTNYRVVRMDAGGNLHATDIETDDSTNGWALRIRDQVAELLATLSESGPTPRQRLEALVAAMTDEQVEMALAALATSA